MTLWVKHLSLKQDHLNRSPQTRKKPGVVVLYNLKVWGREVGR